MGENYRVVRIEEKPSFFKRHNKLLSFVGSMIVLGTFITKEVVQEGLKSHIEALDRSEQRTGPLPEEDLSGDKEAVFAEKSDSPPLTDSTDLQVFMDSLLRFNSDVYHDWLRIDRAGQETRGLVERLPPNTKAPGPRRPTIQSEVESESKLIGQLPIELAKLASQRYTFASDEMQGKFMGPKTKLTKDGRKRLKELRSSYREVYYHSQSDWLNVRMLRKEALEAIESYRDVLEKEHERATIIGYIFYGIGWGLNLIGGVAGVKLEQGAD
jgi:DNA-binding PadR family transcriptional regulator